ncbi:cysteine dioxygenase [Actinokineospora sp.]|uniref:cysteine dioxygenase n=1 Tax=Actinokineospora sp. TaxID=1872133 RepID=UPI00403765B7
MFAVPPNTVALGGIPAGAHPALIARQYAEDRSRWRELLRYDPDVRFVALVDRTDELEVWLMSWLPGQSTDLHDHAQAAGAFTVVCGTLTERVARGASGERPSKVLHQVAAGQSRVFGPGYVHQVRNAGVDPAVSLHVYRSVRPAMGHFQVDPVTGLAQVPPAL